MRRLAATLAATVGLSIAPTPTVDLPRTSAPAAPRIATPADRRAALAWLAAVQTDPSWRRWTDLTAAPADPDDPCPWRRLIARTFPDWPQAVAVAWRESRCQPAAANRSSTARGLMQLLMSLHGHRFVAVGCTSDDWDDAWCNLRAARDLYNAAGASPWAVR